VSAATAPRDPVPFADRKELSAVLSYLRRVHGERAVARAVGVPADSVRWWPDSTTRAGDLAEAVALRRLGLQFVDRWASIDDRSFSLSMSEIPDVDIAGYDLMRRVSFVPNTRNEVEPAGLAIVSSDNLLTLQVARSGAPVTRLDIGAALTRAGLEVGGGTESRVEPVIVEADAGGTRLRLVLEHVSGSRRGDSLVINPASGFLLIRSARPATDNGLAPPRR
jgi:hypothetical protein